MNLLATTGFLLGQADGAAGSAVQVQSVWDFIIKGGPMMIPIGLASLLALAVVIERALSLRRVRIIPAGFLPGLESRLGERPGDAAEALRYCRDDGSPVANIFIAAIRRLGEPIERIEKHVAEAGRREVLKLRRFLRTLAVIASIAPLMGLLGTIFGMIRAFQTVASSGEALGRTELLARGIYEAMITTAAGLIVAIPVLIAHHWLAARIQRLVLDIDQMTVDFIEEHVVRRRTRPVATASAAVDRVPPMPEPAVAAGNSPEVPAVAR
ncbi:MAG: MotA/TolQ/ExbB proton channel family protein [Phycisphaerae bacterium]